MPAEPKRRPTGRRTAADTPVVLTIAGSDSGGGAGIQADLKTFLAFGTFGTSAITCVTAQNPGAVTGIGAIEPDLVARQIRAVCAGFPVAAAKTGMLFAEPIIRIVARTVRECRIPLLVVDPVMVATSGARLLRRDAVRALREELLPLATVMTPNLPEAEVLCGREIRSLAQLRAAARELGEMFGTACVVKGGHLGGAQVHDVLWSEGRLTTLSARRIAAAETHGTGCTFSAALAASLARGEPLVSAARSARDFVLAALRRPVRAGSHRPLGTHVLPRK